MGALRLLLAVGVLLSHTGGNLLAFALTPGDASVQCFFIVSGFLMALILHEKYSAPSDLWTFYSNRFIRIYSLYFLFLAAALLIAVWLFWVETRGPIQAWRAASNRLTWLDHAYLAATSILIFGQDATLFLRVSPDGLQWTPNFLASSPRVYQMMMVPQAWSLALELMFYLIAPFIVRRPVWMIAGLALASTGLRFWWARGGYDEDPWSYRFFPFELTLFLAGVLAYRLYAWVRAREIGGLVYLPAALALAVVVAFPLYDDRQFQFFSVSRLTLLGGLTVGLPFLHLATSSWRIDRAVGELSYPLYLSHEMIASLVPGGGRGASIGQLNARALTVLVVAIIVSGLAARFVEIPIDRFRQARLGKRSEERVRG